MNKVIKVVISGSFRKHLKDIERALELFKKSKIKVLAPLGLKAINKTGNFIFLTTDDKKKSADILEQEFMMNIKKADFLYVVNVGGYIGQSVAAEMGIAIRYDTPIILAEEIKTFSNNIQIAAQKLLKKSSFHKLAINKINPEKIYEINFKNFKPINLSDSESSLLESLAGELLKSLKSVKIADTVKTNHMTKADLKRNPTLRDLQDYVAVVVKERGFEDETIQSIFMLFLEECGEMAKAVRKTQDIKIDKKSKQFQVDQEVADVLMYLLEICNYLNVDLEKAFRDKEEINKKRIWE